jgi:hypothetical protein
MNVLFLTNYFGLHGSSIDLIIFSLHLRDLGHRVFFVGEDGHLKEQFAEVADDLYVCKRRTYLPSLRDVLLLKRLIKRWDIELIIGVGKFLALEGQIANLLYLRKRPISIVNFSPRQYHWESHKKWHIPRVGYLAVNCQYYKEISTSAYKWASGDIHLISARYDIPKEMNRLNNGIHERKNVLMVRRLDSPKYRSVLRSLEQIAAWPIWENWSIRIVGAGTHEELVDEAVKSLRKTHPNSEIVWLGRRKDVTELMRQADIVIGSERVAVEAITQGCLTILATDAGLIDVITPENIEQYSYDNFFGHNYRPLGVAALQAKLCSITGDEKEMNRIIEGNLGYAKANLDASLGSSILSGLMKKAHATRTRKIEVLKAVSQIAMAWLTIYCYLIQDKLARNLCTTKQ